MTADGGAPLLRALEAMTLPPEALLEAVALPPEALLELEDTASDCFFKMANNGGNDKASKNGYNRSSVACRVQRIWRGRNKHVASELLVVPWCVGAAWLAGHLPVGYSAGDDDGNLRKKAMITGCRHRLSPFCATGCTTSRRCATYGSHMRRTHPIITLAFLDSRSGAPY